MAPEGNEVVAEVGVTGWPSPVDNVIAPLEEVPCPVAMETAPPFLFVEVSVVVPADTVTPPPTPEVPVPTVIEMDPPVPEVAAPPVN